MRRGEGLYAARDTEAYEAFDIEYEYDVRTVFEQYLRGEAALSHWLDLLCFQEAVYPANYNKLRFLENHDLPRIASLVDNDAALENLTAMLYFLKGTTLLYAGQEFADNHLPSLFEKEPINRNTGRDLSPLLRTLGRIKREHLDADDAFFARAMDKSGTAVLKRVNAETCKVGIFSLRGKAVSVETEAPDGSYVNLIDGSRVTVLGGSLRCDGKPVIFTYKKLAVQT